MPRRLESLFIPGPAGKLEAILEEPEHEAPREIAIACHPHPQYGGTMFNKVVYRLARGLRATGAAVLRFNFRGVHLSEGSYDNGNGEVDDARATLAFARGRYPDLPFAIAGFSFGSRVALRLGRENPDAARVIAVGLPSDYHDPEFLSHSPTPRLFIQSTHDQFGSREQHQRFVDEIKGPKRLLWVESVDHFFSDALDLFEQTVTRI